MDFKVDEVEYVEPVSPTGHYFNSSVMSICVLGILDFEIPIDDSPTMALLKDVFLPINPRFSSIMGSDEKGGKQWKKVEVKLEDHVKVPFFPPGLSPDSYDKYLSDYLSKIALEKLPQFRPLWDIHIIKYLTSNAAGNLIFKIHHAIGDGYSLVGALLSCLQREDNPSVPLSFPYRKFGRNQGKNSSSILRSVRNVLYSAFDTVSDFRWSFLKSSCAEDDRSFMRSGNPGVEFNPLVISTMTLPLDHVKQIKNKLRIGVTINDVITGIIFLGTRLYMQETRRGKSSNEHSTALVLLNTRMIEGYKSVKEMVKKPDAKPLWGNQFAFLHVSLPRLTNTTVESFNPLEYVWRSHKLIQGREIPKVLFLLLNFLRVCGNIRAPRINNRLADALTALGCEFENLEIWVAAKYVYRTLKNASMTISNLIGPQERMALANHPIKSFYFMTIGSPQNLTITMVSYMGKLRVGFGLTEDIIDPKQLVSCIENALQMMLNAAQ